MSTDSYWTKTLDNRVSRRRALAASGAIGLGGALLAACGGGDEAKSTGPKDTSGLVYDPPDSTKQAKRGGVWKWYQTADIVGLDPYFTAGASNHYSRMIYNRLWTYKTFIKETPTYETVPDLVESFEMSPDKLQVTAKIRSNAKTDPRPPTNGRAIDAYDVQYSWKEYSTRASQASEIVDAVGVTSMTAIDARTVVIKLKAPSPGLFAAAAFIGSGRFNIVPKEAEDKFDIRREAHGAGYFQLETYEPSSRMVFVRNPGYFRQPQPFVDKVESPIISEYAAGLAQFKAGAIYNFIARPEDILATKREVPALKLYRTEVNGASARTFFGQRPGAASPFKDERVRQAFSMAQDRDLYVDTFYNVANFEKEGLPVEASWNSSAAYNHWTGWWLDPKSKDFGPNAKYMQHDLAEAKKLLAAAGHPNGFEVSATFAPAPASPAQRNFDALAGFALEAGMKLNYNQVQNPTPWRPNYYYARGNWDGIGFITIRGAGDTGVAFNSYYHPTGGIFPGFDPDGKSSFAGDPFLTQLVEKINLEFDQQKRYTLAHELQRYDAKKQYFPSFPGGASGFTLAWPALQNFQVHNQVEDGGGSNEDEALFWIDETQPPFKKA
ncbi:MAG TPA: ABC transporter substrate-binding protein [Dehalococcoidia bacterium]|nr:ABC transporter substrate-binding protein [Dehalococcoidia bacterium]